MDSNEQGIQELAVAFAKFIPILAGKDAMKNARFITANVTSVNETDRTCAVTGILDGDEIKYTDVNLSSEQNDGFILIPAVDSTVIIAKMPDGEKYVIQTSDISKVICYIDSSNYYTFDTTSFSWNGGTNGGIAKTLSVANQLNAIENKLNTLLGIFFSWVPVANDGGAALKALYTALAPTTLAPLTLSTQAGISNAKIKH